MGSMEHHSYIAAPLGSVMGKDEHHCDPTLENQSDCYPKRWEEIQRISAQTLSNIEKKVWYKFTWCANGEKHDPKVLGTPKSSGPLDPFFPHGNCLELMVIPHSFLDRAMFWFLVSTLEIYARRFGSHNAEHRTIQGVLHLEVPPNHPFGSVSKPCTPGEHQNSW